MGIIETVIINIYDVLLILIRIFFCLVFYSKIKNQSLKKLTHLAVPITYVALYLLRITLITRPLSVPLQAIVLVATLSALLTVFEKKISWMILLASLLMTMVLEMLAMLIAIIIIFALNMVAVMPVAIMTVMVVLLIVHNLILLLDKSQKLSLASYGELLKSTQLQKIIVILALLVAMLQAFMVESGNFHTGGNFMDSTVMWGIVVILVLALILLITLASKYMNEEKNKQEQIKAENARLSKERLVTQEQMASLLQAQAELEADFSEMTNNHHAYRYVVPILLGMQNKLIEQMNNFADYDHDERLCQIRNYTDQLRTLTFEISDEFVTSHIKSEIVGLGISKAWLELNVLLETLMQKAKDQGIYLSVYNHATTWHKLVVPKVVFIRLLSNIVDNAIKETFKLPLDKRGEIRIIFKDEDDHFLFEVTDHAPEFAVAILKRLGQRQNSTNNTGNGYAEIMPALHEAKASFVIKEWRHDRGDIGKTISVIFDGFSMRLIDSHYRYEQLVNELSLTDFEVIDIY